MAIVIDASIAAAWFLPDEENAAADKILDGLLTAPGHVPALFWFELRNILLMAERRGRLPPGRALLSMVRLHGLPLQDEGSGNDAMVLGLAAKHRLTGYDAAYVALAAQMGIPLATADEALAEAARSEGVALV